MPFSESAYTPRRRAPARARGGLKIVCFLLDSLGHWSRPARARGLKQIHGQAVVRHRQVAPRAGAWIELFKRGAGIKSVNGQDYHATPSRSIPPALPRPHSIFPANFAFSFFRKFTI